MTRPLALAALLLLTGCETSDILSVPTLARSSAEYQPTRSSTGQLTVTVYDDLPPGTRLAMTFRHGAEAGVTYTIPVVLDRPDPPPETELRVVLGDLVLSPGQSAWTDAQVTALERVDIGGTTDRWDCWRPHAREVMRSEGPNSVRSTGLHRLSDTGRAGIGADPVVGQMGDSPSPCPPGTAPLPERWAVVNRIGPGEEPPAVCVAGGAE